MIHPAVVATSASSTALAMRAGNVDAIVLAKSAGSSRHATVKNVPVERTAKPVTIANQSGRRTLPAMPNSVVNALNFALPVNAAATVRIAATVKLVTSVRVPPISVDHRI